MAALFVRVCPCLSLCPSRLSSRSNADASAPYKRVDSTVYLAFNPHGHMVVVPESLV
ncbi:hypothetical protein NP493_1104g04058 [Ridgeia piscesae]|uniref:Uncharacterized protein n=1 Tax=Ridgeia piscesae TaxID=27915 RepID=A0AAD9KG87_RIDPI|nr:hypothetical protein NP493_1104g04058 [Ridgeia piscesae]